MTFASFRQRTGRNWKTQRFKSEKTSFTNDEGFAEEHRCGEAKLHKGVKLLGWKGCVSNTGNPFHQQSANSVLLKM